MRSVVRREFRHATVADVFRYAARNDAVEQVAVAEQFGGEPQPVFLQPPELHEAEGQGDVVAEVAEVAQVIGDTLDFQEQGAQPHGTVGHLARGGGFHCHAVGPGVGAVRVAGNAPGELGASIDVHPLEALFRALVGVAEALFEFEDALADDGEAEMSRFDGAGVDRADRDLVHPLAFDADEGVGIGVVGGRQAGIEVLAQREDVRRPGAVAQPFAIVDRVGRGDAEQIEGRALHAVGLREDVGEVGVGRRFRRERAAHPGKPGAGEESCMNGKAAVQLAVIRSPQGNELSACFLDCARQREQLSGLHAAAPDVLAEWVEIPVVFADLHLSLPIVALPACTRQRDTAG